MEQGRHEERCVVLRRGRAFFGQAAGVHGYFLATEFGEKFLRSAIGLRPLASGCFNAIKYYSSGTRRPHFFSIKTDEDDMEGNHCIYMYMCVCTYLLCDCTVMPFYCGGAMQQQWACVR